MRLLPLVLAACSSAEVAPDTAVEEPCCDAEIPDLVTAPPVAVWAPEEAVNVLAYTLGADFPSPFTVRASLESVFAHGDEACPGVGTYMAGPSFEGCTSEEGWYYLGVGGYTETFAEDEGGTYVDLAVSADLTILDPEGASLDIGGHWNETLHDGPTFRGFLNGSWLEPASGAEWLATGMSGWLDYAGTVSPTMHHVSLDGAMTLHAFSEGATTLTFDRVEIGNEGCGEVPAGAFGVRDPAGGAWRVDFGPDCTPCGVVSFEGTPVATDACLMLDGLTDRVIRASTP